MTNKPIVHAYHNSESDPEPTTSGEEPIATSSDPGTLSPFSHWEGCCFCAGKEREELCVCIPGGALSR